MKNFSGENLVFLISQPRSGSTLLQAILGGHPDVHTCSEPWIALPHIYAFKKKGAEFNFNGSWANHAITEFFTEGSIDDEYYNLALNTFLTSLYQKVLSGSGKNFFLDKTPRYYEIASELIKIFPDAKFIVLYRHPLAVFSSILRTWVKHEIDMLYYYSRDLLVAPRKLTNFVSEHSKSICQVHYEEFVKSPTEEIRRLCNYIGVEFYEDIINYKTDQEWAFGDKKIKDKSAPDITSIDAWKGHLKDQRSININYYYLRDLGEEIFSRLGYDFATAFNEIKALKPNVSDMKVWKILMHHKFIFSIEEQRRQARNKLYNNPFKGMLKRFFI